MLMQGVAGIAVLTAISVSALQYWNLRTSAFQSRVHRGEVGSFKRWVHAQVNCLETMQANKAICEATDSSGKPVGGLVDGIGADKHVFISRTSGRIKDPATSIESTQFKGRTHCLSQGGITELRVQVQRIAGGNSFVDPLTKKAMTWEDVAPVPLLCGPSVPQTGGSYPIVIGGEGCTHIRHGGSAAAANGMNKTHGFPFACAVSASIPMVGSPPTPAGSPSVHVSVKVGQPPASRQYGSPPTMIPWVDNALAYYPYGKGPDCSGLTLTADIADTASPYYMEADVLGNVGYFPGAVGKSEKYYLYTLSYDPASRAVTVRTQGDGWGQCRFDNACAACVSDFQVEVRR